MRTATSHWKGSLTPCFGTVLRAVHHPFLPLTLLARLQGSDRRRAVVANLNLNAARDVAASSPCFLVPR